MKLQKSLKLLLENKGDCWETDIICSSINCILYNNCINKDERANLYDKKSIITWKYNTVLKFVRHHKLKLLKEQ